VSNSYLVHGITTCACEVLSLNLQVGLINVFLFYMICTVNTQHTSRQDALITIRLYLTTCFGRDRPSAGQLRTILRYSKNTRVNRKVKAIFKLRGNRDREELPHCAVLTVPVEEFSHV